MAIPSISESKLSKGAGNQQISTSFTTLPAVGDWIIVAQTSGGSSSTGDTCSDNQSDNASNPYVKVATQTGVEFWKKKVGVSAGTFTVTTFGNNSSANAHVVMCVKNGDPTNIIAGTPGTVTHPGFDATSISLSSGDVTHTNAITLLCHTNGSSGKTPTYSGNMSLVLSDTTGGIDSVISVGKGTVSASGAQTTAVSWTGVDSYDAVAITLQGVAPGPLISVQPTDQTVNEGGTATFTCTVAASDGGSPTLQWKKFNGTIFVNVSGGTASYSGGVASYTTPAVAFSDQQSVYRLTATDTNGSVNSSIALLRVAFRTTGTGPRVTPPRVRGAGAGSAFLQGTYTPGTTTYRGLVLVGSEWKQCPTASVGTGLKPLVLNGAEIKQRAAAEGLPIVLINGSLQTLPSGATLEI